MAMRLLEPLQVLDSIVECLVLASRRWCLPLLLLLSLPSLLLLFFFRCRACSSISTNAFLFTAASSTAVVAAVATVAASIISFLFAAVAAAAAAAAAAEDRRPAGPSRKPQSDVQLARAQRRQRASNRGNATPKKSQIHLSELRWEIYQEYADSEDQESGIVVAHNRLR